MQKVQHPDLILVGGLVPKMWLDNTSLRNQLNDALASSAIARLLNQRNVQFSSIALSEESPISFQLPHEQFLAHLQGYASPSDWLANQALTPFERQMFANTWRVLPVHCRLATDHISLANVALEGLSVADAQSFIASLELLVADYGARLQVSEQGNWFLAWPDLTFDDVLPSSPYAALGRSIDAYLPRDAGKGNKARLWRRFVTECEMSWFDHANNAARSTKNLLPLNSLWLVGRVTESTPFLSTPTNDSINALSPAALSAIMSDEPFEWSVAMKTIDSKMLEAIGERVDANQQQTVLLTNDQHAQLLTVSKRKFWQSGLAFSAASLGLQTEKH